MLALAKTRSAVSISAVIPAKRATQTDAKINATVDGARQKGNWLRRSVVTAHCGGCASLASCHLPFCLYARPIPVFQQSPKGQANGVTQGFFRRQCSWLPVIPNGESQKPFSFRVVILDCRGKRFSNRKEKRRHENKIVRRRACCERGHNCSSRSRKRSRSERGISQQRSCT